MKPPEFPHIPRTDEVPPAKPSEGLTRDQEIRAIAVDLAARLVFPHPPWELADELSAYIQRGDHPRAIAS